LKPRHRLTSTEVECPVRTCSEWVPRQRGRFRLDDKFRCPEHGIFISPETWAYGSDEENLLWTNQEDQELLKAIKSVKRYNRFKHDRCEDAATWNFFRCFERARKLHKLAEWSGIQPDGQEELVYWGYSANEKQRWSALTKARSRSEPDLIFLNSGYCVIVEAKLGAPNRIEQLHRFWNLGQQIAQDRAVRFVLLSLICEGKTDVTGEQFLVKFMNRSNPQFVRATWEGMFDAASGTISSSEYERLVRYVKDKTLGYDRKTWSLVPAFRRPSN